MLFPFLCSLVFFYSNVVVCIQYNFLRHIECDNTSNYTSNSTFSTNLAQALNTLQSSTATTGFNTTTAGNLIEPVTALALCRGSSSPSTCQSCIAEASSGIRSSCPSQKSAQVWYDLCMVRYSSTNFISKPNNNIVFFVHWEAPVATSDLDSYSQRVEYLLRNLSSTAVSSEKRYAVGRTELLNLTGYGYVDCTRDISSEDCRTCLVSAMEATKGCCLTKPVSWMLTPTCNFQFNTDPAHLDWLNAPLVKYEWEAAVAPSTVGSGGGNCLAIKFLLGGAVLTVILVIGVLWVVVAKARKRGKVKTDSSGNAEEMWKKECIGTRPFLYDLDQLAVATNQFSPSNRLGRGGFGTVYKD
ncbi:hypothetical protein F0562_005294 [Nyssa sinensis]|uniref:Gnk2-homologous domain-containing protein n=1 Tax=Nyssa sinensis TaxID=561372 RepID=A0A5J5AHN8_9ASTE|nr:hypothetical protein F0562_005294 [Nyssa sinensis]